MGKAELREYIRVLLGELAEKSVKRKVATLKAFFHLLEREDAVAVNPFRKMDVHPRAAPGYRWTANGRALTTGETEAFVKVIRDTKYGEILGAHIVGPHATELIAEFVVGRHLESTVEEMDRAMHPHPTLSEAIGEAALAALGHALHI